MNMSWLQAALYGIVSGLTEFLPVSSQAHQLILRSLFGADDVDYLLNFFAHAGMLAGLLLSTGSYIKNAANEYRFSKSSRRRRKREVNLQAVCDINFVKTACIPMLLSFLLYAKTQKWQNTVPLVSLFLLLNGIVLLVPMYLSRGNKDSRNMSTVDGALFGVLSALSVLPGVSRVGTGCSFATARGAEPQHAYKWSLLLSIPVLIVLTCFDLVSLFTVGMAGAGALYVIKCILCGACAYVGAGLAILLMKTLTVRNNLSLFSYYSIGAALFAFILYLY